MSSSSRVSPGSPGSSGTRTSFRWRSFSTHCSSTRNRPENSGTADDGIVNPKFTIAFEPWRKTEFYASAGGGFHSNDGRGATITVDPVTGDPAERVDPLVRARGAEAASAGESGAVAEITADTPETPPATSARSCRGVVTSTRRPGEAATASATSTG